MNQYNQVPHLAQDTTWKSDKITIRHHKQEPRGQPLPSRWPQGSNEQIHRKHCLTWVFTPISIHWYTEMRYVISNNLSVQPPLTLRNYKWCSVSSLRVIECASDQQRLWSDCAYAQADQNLCLLHIPHCWKSHFAPHILWLLNDNFRKQRRRRWRGISSGSTLFAKTKRSSEKKYTI